MKNTTLITLIFLAFTSGAFAKAKAPAAAAAMGGDLFADKEKGFSVMLPKKWEIKKGVMGAEVIALRPKGGSKDAFRENINVVVENLNGTMLPKEYFKASQSVLQKVFAEFKVEKSGHTNIDKHDVYWVIFTHKMGGVRAKVLQYLTVEGNKGYVVTGSALPATFDKFKKSFEMVATSLKLSPSAEIVKK
jgi:hypothetical protein